MLLCSFLVPLRFAFTLERRCRGSAGLSGDFPKSGAVVESVAPLKRSVPGLRQSWGVWLGWRSFVFLLGIFPTSKRSSGTAYASSALPRASTPTRTIRPGASCFTSWAPPPNSNGRSFASASMPGSRPPGKQARRWDGPKRVFDRSSVHALRAQGLSIREIATRLDVGMGTVTRTLAETLAEAA